jgi:N-methylhydantoinase A
MIALGVDVGGTNTDIILSGLDGGDDVLVHKLPSTRHDPSEATVRGMLEACEIAGIAPGEIDLVLHGTTVATNSLLEYDGARTGMLTTAGFRDIIHIGRHRRPHNFSLMQDIPYQVRPLVERKHRLTVRERVVPPGEVLVPLDEEEAVRAIEQLRSARVDSICVCFLFSFLNPANEIRAGELIGEHYPEADVSLSHRVIAQFREFERFTTTAVNAFVKPKVRRYLERLEQGLREAGVGAPLQIMQSNGGVADAANAGARPVNVLLSGPAAGVIAGKYVGNVHGYENLITLDIGGTSADISVVPGRLLELNPVDSYLGGYPVLSPKLDVTSIGAGGGSIAWADEAGAFNVGPRSAGAEPGPAAYGRGGTEPAVTDAHVVLGRINPDNFLGGRLRLRGDLAREAVGRIAERFSMSTEEAAVAILTIVNANMVREIRVHSIRRGYDPRECALVAFGGAGPLHACDIAEQLQIPIILVPPAPGITSAMGLLATDLRYDVVRTIGRPLAEAEWTDLDTAFSDMEAELLARFAGGNGAKPTLHRRADCRYVGQGYELAIACDDLGDDWRDRIGSMFHAQHEREYGFHFPNDPIEIVNLRVTATAPNEARPTMRATPESGEAPEPATTAVLFALAEGPVQIPTYERESLRSGDLLHGPVIVHEMDSTVVVSPAWNGEVLADGTIRLWRKEV